MLLALASNKDVWYDKISFYLLNREIRSVLHCGNKRLDFAVEKIKGKMIIPHLRGMQRQAAAGSNIHPESASDPFLDHGLLLTAFSSKARMAALWLRLPPNLGPFKGSPFPLGGGGGGLLLFLSSIEAMNSRLNSAAIRSSAASSKPAAVAPAEFCLTGSS